MARSMICTCPCEMYLLRMACMYPCTVAFTNVLTHVTIYTLPISHFTYNATSMVCLMPCCTAVHMGSLLLPVTPVTCPSVSITAMYVWPMNTYCSCRSMVKHCVDFHSSNSPQSSIVYTSTIRITFIKTLHRLRIWGITKLTDQPTSRVAALRLRYTLLPSLVKRVRPLWRSLCLALHQISSSVRVMCLPNTMPRTLLLLTCPSWMCRVRCTSYLKLYTSLHRDRRRQRSTSMNSKANLQALRTKQHQR